MTEIVNISKKVLLLGDPAVGKTSLIRKFVYDRFDDKYITTLGTKISRKQMVIKHPSLDIRYYLNLLIWDLMGQIEYKFFHASAYSGAHGAFIVCDVTRLETLENISEWILNLFKVTNMIPLVFLGNKNDLVDQKKFGIDDIKNIVTIKDPVIFITSAKTGENIENAFSILGRKLLKVE